MKKKIFIFVLLILVLLFISGCPKVNVDVDANEVKNEAECRNLKGNYIWIAGRCCPDTNKDLLCDGDEGIGLCTSGNECEQSGCMDYNQFVPYDCVVGEDKCLHKKEVNIQIDRCGVECLNAEGCRLGQKCVNYKCESKVCGDDQCDDTENCNCKDCNLGESQRCCDGITVEGNCCNDEDCTEETPSCVSNICTPLCGNGILDEGEDCDVASSEPLSEHNICTKECKLEIQPHCGDGNCDENENCICEDCSVTEGMFCCEDGIEAECCSDEHCTEENQTCVEKVCSILE